MREVRLNIELAEPLQSCSILANSPIRQPLHRPRRSTPTRLTLHFASPYNESMLIINVKSSKAGAFRIEVMSSVSSETGFVADRN